MYRIWNYRRAGNSVSAVSRSIARTSSGVNLSLLRRPLIVAGTAASVAKM